MKNIILLLFFQAFLLDVNAQNDRVVFWLHGLGGDNAAFTKVAFATTYNSPDQPIDYPARRAYSVQLGYENHSYDLRTAAGYIEEKVRLADHHTFSNGINNFSNNFIIAHSQGGLVARRLDMLYANNPTSGRRINGIVTFGTPHQGAKILDNVGKFGDFITSGCTELTAGPLSELIENNFLLDLVTSGTRVSQIVAPLCTLFGGVAPLQFNDFTQPITEDYKPSKPGVLNQLNSFPSTIPKVGFYGIEEKPTQVWRVMYNIIDKKPNEFPAFTADEDNKLANSVDMNKQKYAAKQAYWDNRYYGLIGLKCTTWWDWFIDFGSCNVINHLLDDADHNRLAWKRGAEWWAGANDRFRNINGSLGIQETPIMVNECNCTAYDYDGNSIYDWIELGDELGCSSYGWLTSCYPTGNLVPSVSLSISDKDSDGVVLAESAMNFPGAQAVAVMPGSNHQQMRNDSNTKKRLLELWGGTHGIFFKTDIK